jgi:isopentenyldiphosphate isomerase
MTEEIFEIVNEAGEVIGTAPRSECHGNPDLLHRVAHVLVFNLEGKLCLQLRPEHKDVQPNKWDTSVGGHVDPGESPLEAAHREMAEELGIEAELTFIYSYIWRSTIESELVNSYKCIYGGELKPNAYELADCRWWTASEIDDALGGECFTENFELEWSKFKTL